MCVPFRDIVKLHFNKISGGDSTATLMFGSSSGFKEALTILAIHISHNQPVEVIFLRQQP